jgi:hypothetical protein
VTNQLGVAQHGSRAMVIAVQEGQRLFLEKQEYSIEKLEILGQIGQLSFYQHLVPKLFLLGAKRT